VPYKDPEKRKAYHREYGKKWYKKNCEEVKKRTKTSRQRCKEKWDKFKAAQSCTICGFSHPAAIDFHHTSPHPDNPKVNELARRRSYGKAIEEATTNCIPLCSNCHRIHHWDEHKKRVPEDPSSDD